MQKNSLKTKQNSLKKKKKALKYFSKFPVMKIWIKISVWFSSRVELTLFSSKILYTLVIPRKLTGDQKVMNIAARGIKDSFTIFLFKYEYSMEKKSTYAKKFSLFNIFYLFIFNDVWFFRRNKILSASILFYLFNTIRGKNLKTSWE